MSATAAPVEVFWRPGCGFCAALRRDLRRRGIESLWHDIWSDEPSRAYVRSVNAGNETVPTVRIGTTVLTNPSGAQVAAELGLPPAPAVGPVARVAAWLRR